MIVATHLDKCPFRQLSNYTSIIYYLICVACERTFVRNSQTWDEVNLWISVDKQLYHITYQYSSRADYTIICVGISMFTDVTLVS